MLATTLLYFRYRTGRAFESLLSATSATKRQKQLCCTGVEDNLVRLPLDLFALAALPFGTILDRIIPRFVRSLVYHRGARWADGRSFRRAKTP
jgi:hypothetical protein